MGEAKRRTRSEHVVPDTGTYDYIEALLTPDDVDECFELHIKHREIRLHGAELVDLKRKIDDAFLAWVTRSAMVLDARKF